MLEAPQFLHILAAEAELLVTVSIFLPPDAKASFERRLIDAFSSDSFSDTTKLWNEERSLVVQETLEQHLLPVGVKWTREWLREEVEDFVATRCAGRLREVPTFSCHLNNSLLMTRSVFMWHHISHPTCNPGAPLLFSRCRGARAILKETSLLWSSWMKSAGFANKQKLITFWMQNSKMNSSIS